jgi:hypothetical protein
MSGLASLIAAPADVRQAALALLDELSAPLEPRALERALQTGGLTRSQARRAMHALRGVHVVALVPK